MIAIFAYGREWGGVDVLISRLAGYLLTRGYEFVVIEQEGSRLRESLPDSHIVTLKQLSNVAGRVTHLIVPSVSKICHPSFPWKQLEHAKMFVWVVHPNDAFRCFYPLSRAMDYVGYRAVRPLQALFSDHTKLVAGCFEYLCSANAIATMDGATTRALRYFYPNLVESPAIVPIPSPVAIGEVPLRGREPSTLTVGYLGRIDSMKWSALAPFIRYELAPLKKRFKVSLLAITEGLYRDRLVNLCKKTGVEIRLFGYLENRRAREVIVAETDLAVAMGTSALDIAGAGHPCIIIDPCMVMWAPRQRNFQFIHERSDYTLGEFRDFPNYPSLGRPFTELIQDDYLKEAKTSALRYVCAAHDPSACFDRFLHMLMKSEVTTMHFFAEHFQLADKSLKKIRTLGRIQ